MMEFTHELVRELIVCPKRIIKAPSREMKQDRGHWKNSFEVESDNGEYRFIVFIRYNDAFPENFSIGLEFNPNDQKGTVSLMRCNGAHGDTLHWEHHNKPHIHYAIPELINQGLKSATSIEITKEYNSWQEVLHFFIKKTNIKGADAYFSEPQGNLFDSPE